MSKYIDINNEEEILKECDIVYYNNCKYCSRELCKFYNDICFTEEDKFLKTEAYVDLGRIAITLNQQDQRISELEEQLKNAIVPKFKPHEDLFVIIDYIDGTKSIEQYYIDEIIIRGNGKYIEYRDIGQKMVIGEDDLLFGTYKEAQAKLKELQGEKK